MKHISDFLLNRPVLHGVATVEERHIVSWFHNNEHMA